MGMNSEMCVFSVVIGTQNIPSKRKPLQCCGYSYVIEEAK